MAIHHITITARITAYRFFFTVSHEMYSILLAYVEHLTQTIEFSFEILHRHFLRCSRKSALKCYSAFSFFLRFNWIFALKNRKKFDVEANKFFVFKIFNKFRNAIINKSNCYT